MSTLEDEPTLYLSKVDHDFFLKRVLSDNPDSRAEVRPSLDSHYRIADAADIAAKHIRDLVVTLPDDSKSRLLNNWVNFLEDKATVIFVQVPDDKNAYIVFETMNDRGLTPSAADLLKNHLFGIADTRSEEAERNWIAMTGALETIPDSDEDIVVTYIRHLWISQHGPTRTKALFDNVKKEIKGKQAAIDLTSELATSASLYAALLNPAHDKWNAYGPSSKKNIDTLCSLGAEQLRPLLLSAIRHFSIPEANQFLLTTVCWTVRYLITGTSGSGALEGYYGRTAFEIHEGRITTTDAFASAMAAILPTDDAFRPAFSVARVAKAHLGRYYLMAMQRKEDGENEPQYVPNDAGAVNLEHILPQSPSEDWEGDADTLKANHRRLGNMVLLQANENKIIGNSGYNMKKPFLKKSAFSLTREAAEYEKWGIDEIDKRQTRLAQLAVATWPLRP